VSGTSDASACGTGGLACTKCDAGKACKAGVCVSSDCASSCATCCDPTLGCTGGDSDSGACGLNGVACMACPGGKRCDGGACIPTAPCAGCYAADGTCVAGTSDAACGQNGHLCVDCGSQLHCYDGADGDSSSVIRGCNIPHGTSWDVLLYSGTVSQYQVPGIAWDLFGLPDPQVGISACDSSGAVCVSGASEVRNDTLTPDWGGAVVVANIPAEKMYELVFKTVDVDPLGSDLMEVGYYPIVTYHSQAGVSAIVKAMGGALLEVSGLLGGATLHFKIRPHQ
jgi:hypothetical protein